MLVLDTTTRKLQAVLAGAITTSQPQVSVVSYDVDARSKPTAEDYRRSLTVTNTNSATDVDICAAPGTINAVRHIEHVCVFNKDSVAATVTVKIDDGGTETILVSQALAAGESLVYERGQGWQVI